jgi:hypothetical protein
VGRQHRLVVAHLEAGRRRRRCQLNLSPEVERVGGGQQLPDPGAGLAHVVPQEPEQPEDPERVRQRPGVVVEVPAHGGSQIAVVDLEAFGPLALAGAAQWPVGLLGQRPVVVRVPPADLGGVGPGRQPLGHKRANRLQHPQPGAVVGRVEMDQAVPGQRLEAVQRLVLVQAGHLRGGLGGPAVHEHRRGLQQRPLGVLQ